MAQKAGEKRKFFTFTWALENASYCWHKNNERLPSPMFVVDGIEKTKWRLSLYPRGMDNAEYISCGLNRLADDTDIDSVEVDFDIAFITEDGTVLKISNVKRHSFQKRSKCYGFDEFEKRYEVFVVKRSIFLPDDILRVRCRIWKSVGEITEKGQWFARTCIGVEKRSFVWNIEKFSKLDPSNVVNYTIKSVLNENPVLSLNLFLTHGSRKTNSIHCKLVCSDQSIKYCTLQMLLLPTSENAIKCCQNEFWFGVSEKAFYCFTLNLTKEKVEKSKNLYLPGDVLSLFCECNFSSGIILEEIVKIIHECPDSQVEQLSAFSNGSKVRKSDSTLVSERNKETLYHDHFLCDIKLKTKTGIFPAHKKVLIDMSPVFEKKLSDNPVEDSNDCIFIDDLEDETVRQVLLYMYAEVVEDLHWKDAYNLYEAAEKYQISSLKSKCTSILKSKLCPENACRVLLLADLHQDSNMLSIVQEFILKHDKDIISSEEWNNLVQENMKLAADILYLKLNE
ncbi:BTB and MATH domain-containing protein 43 [Argiope bruennichi]|uniref:BTB and MATH domain-containing protein 43 n=1 Tax=Argiope bruennichi TaxID=94029 RepID=A0A8T0EE65_ARGBR|nr:BTB and MATH domain-containing protein 43 [Argiope bruennichi]